MIKNKKGPLVNGIPIKAKLKYLIVGILLVLLVLNVVLPQYIDILNFPGQGWISFIFIVLAVLFSIGSYTTETIIIAITTFVFISACYDMAVLDFSSLRRKIMIVAPIILFIEITFGKVGVIHLIKLIKNQFGVSGQ